jgi:hypothetical protein
MNYPTSQLGVIGCEVTNEQLIISVEQSKSNEYFSNVRSFLPPVANQLFK